MLSCDVVSDLMLAYASGEASAETRRLVEEHLAQCRKCREAFGDETPVENALEDLPPAEKPPNGRGFIARTRRLIFAVVGGVLLLFLCVSVMFTRTVIDIYAGPPPFVAGPWPLLPHLPMPWMIPRGIATLGIPWLAPAVGLLILHALAMRWRTRRQPGRKLDEVLLSLLAAVPFLILALIAGRMMTVGTAMSAMMSFMFLGIAMVVTFAQLPRLPYMTAITILTLLIGIGFLAGRSTAAIMATGIMTRDMTVEPTGEFSRPPGGMSPEDAVRVDLSSLGPEWIESTIVDRVNNVPVGPGSRAVRATYRSEEHQVQITMVKSEDTPTAQVFFEKWRDALESGARVPKYQITVEGEPEIARAVHTYSSPHEGAYFAWQMGNWVTIVAVPGPMVQTLPLARVVKGLVVDIYSDE